MKKVFALILTIFSLLVSLHGFAQSKWTIRQCVDTALTRNLSLLETNLTNETKQVDLQQAKYQRYPSLSFLGKETYYHYYSNSDLSNNYPNLFSGNYGFNSSVVLYSGNQLQMKIKQHALDYQAGKLDIEKLKNDMSLSVVNAYLQILLNYEQLDLTKEVLKQINLQYDFTNQQVKYGKLPAENLTTVQAQIAAQKYAISQAESNLYISKVNLMQLMQIPVTDNFDVDKPVIPDSSAIQESLAVKSLDVYNTALGNQPQIQSAKIKEDLASINTKIAEAAYMPTLSLNGNVGTLYSSTAKNKAFQDYAVKDQLVDNFSNSIGFSLSIPIFNNWLTKATVIKAKMNEQYYSLDKTNVELQLRVAIEQAYANFSVAAKNYESALEYVNATKISYSNVEHKFGLGLLTALDLLTERNAFVTATSQVIETKYQYLFAAKILDFYQGKPLN